MCYILTVYLMGFNMRSFGVLLFLLLLFCSKAPDQLTVIDDEEFVQIYCDVILKVEFLSSDRKEAFVDSVLTHYGTTRETFDNTLQSFGKNPKRWEQIFKQILKELEDRQQQIETADQIKSKS